MIIFVFDPTPACGYSIDSQIDLYNEIKDNFTQDGKINMLIIMNKKDLASPTEINYLKDKLNLNEGDYFMTNALTGDNLDTLINYLKQKYDNKS